MTREQARENINALISELPKAKKRVGGSDTYICPFCGNGSGSDGDGISTKDGIHFKCFKCDFYGDYLAILRKRDNLSESKVFERYGISINDNNSTHSQAQVSSPADYTDFFKEAQKTLRESPEALSYLKGRGISLETATRFMLGYCPGWQSPTALRNGKNPIPSRRVIIPTSKTGYTARALDNDTPDKYRFMKEGEAGYFGKKALYGVEPVFIVEAAFDALSIYEVGGSSCALGSTSGVDRFLDMIDRERPTVPLILSLDNDKAGQEAQVKLKAGLEMRKISFYEVNVSGEHKDPNEHLQHNREAFAALVHSDPAETAWQEAESERTAYLETASAFHIDAFMDEVSDNANTSAIPTGFEKLDTALDGGLYSGLYIVGAISSLGKTTFILQAADQIAKAGYDVMIFSLEMSRYELMAKSISRLTFENCGGTPGNAKTTRGILDGARWKNYSKAEQDLIKRSITIYKEYSSHIFIHEGVGNIGVEQIKQAVQKHISFAGNTPIVIIDYLQIISPHDERATDKQIVDRAVMELKRLSRDKKISVIAISSFNRDNYTAPVNMTSFKESGGVEYSSDVLIGIQLAGMDELSQSDSKRAETTRKIEEKKAADPRKIQLKILKNRNGKVGVNLYFDYFPMFNSLKESDD
jgi:replicative DNA helicase